MSLLLDALKKAEAQQGLANNPGIPANSASDTLLQLEPIAAPLHGGGTADPVYKSIPKPASAPPRQTAQHVLNAAQAGAPRLGASMRQHAGFSLNTPAWLTFPVVVAAVLVIGGSIGAYTLYREYTYMPSATLAATSVAPAVPIVHTAPPSAVQNQPLPEPASELKPMFAPSAPVNPVEASNRHTDNPSVAPPAQQPALSAPVQNQMSVAANQLEPRAPQRSEINTPRSAANSTSANSRPLNIQRDGGSSDTLGGQLNAGWQALQRGDTALAQTHYQRALQFDRSNLDAWLGLGYIAQQEGRWQEAERNYRQALALDPRDAYANSALANLRSMNQTGSDAMESRLKSLGQETGTHQEHGALHFALGNQQAAQQRWAEAQQSYFKAVASDPRNAEYLFNLAVSLDQLHQTRPAYDYYQKALQLARDQMRNHRAVRFDMKAAEARAAALGEALQPTASP